MAKLRVTNLSKVKLKVRRQIIQTMRSKKVRQEVGKAIVDGIRDESMGSVTNPATIAWRKYLSVKNKTHPKYEPTKYNATFTGELLKDLEKNVVADFSDGKAQFVLEHTDKKHKKYKKPDGGTLKGKPATYKQISQWLLQLGYPYLVFSNENKKNVLEVLRDVVKKKLKKRLE